MSTIPAQTRATLSEAIAADHDQALARLREWIALPSINAEKLNRQEGAELMQRMLLDAGFDTARIIPTDGAPGVFARLDAGAPTTLAVYFMYDVKQFEADEWTSPPLEGKLVERDGKTVLIGRGAINQKGPEATLLTAIRAFKATGTPLPVNIVLVAEGEEETGSEHFGQITSEPEVAKALSESVGVILPVAWQGDDGSVEIFLGAKGVAEVQLVADAARSGRGPGMEIHSMNAARVENPAWRLVKALDTLVADDGYTPAIDGWMDDVRPLSDEQVALIDAGLRPEAEAGLKKSLKVRDWIAGEDYRTSLVRLASQPTVNIQGLVSGYTGPGGKTSMPSRAEAKIDFRLVPDMKADEAVAKLRAHLDKRGFTDIEIVAGGIYGPTETPGDAAVVEALVEALAGAGVPHTLTPRLAGSWPGYRFTDPPVSLPAVFVGIGQGGQAHAPDEWYLVEAKDPRLAGMDRQALFYAEFLYALANSRP
ncbi:MAG TPA: M20/M25/M40 family metallo-hydrolase [Arenimonas sp.]|nr:M20/M25/M40 family metallo-hydrolase [Arenimonas sp.]